MLVTTSDAGESVKESSGNTLLSFSGPLAAFFDRNSFSKMSRDGAHRALIDDSVGTSIDLLRGVEHVGSSSCAPQRVPFAKFDVSTYGLPNAQCMPLIGHVVSVKQTSRSEVLHIQG